MKQELAPPPFVVTGGTAWAAGVFGGPLAWFASQQVSYALVPWTCHGGPLLAIHLTNLAALAAVVLTGALAWRDWRRTGGAGSDEAAPPEGRTRFVALLGMTLSALFGLAILAQAGGALFFGPCQR